MRARGKIVLVKSKVVAEKYGENTTFASKTQFSRYRFQLVFEPGAFRY